MNCKTQKPEFRMIECSISNLGKVVTGKTPSTKNSLFWEGDIPFITPKDIQKTKHIFDTERNLTFEGMKSVKNCVLPENAICVSCIGNIGYVAKTTSPAVTNQQINSIIVNDANNSDYVYYLMRSLWQRFKNYEGQSTTLSILNKRQFSEIKILIHEDKAVQTKIANVLSSLDNKIELNEKINQNLEAQAQAIFKSWFVDFEPFKNGKFVDSELGKIPEGWRVGRLSDICDIKMGQSPSGESLHINSDGAIFFQGRADFGSRFPKNRLYTSEPRRMAKEGSILLSVRAPVGDINIAMDSCCIGRGLASIHSRNQSFLYYLLQSLRRLFDMYNGEGTVFGAINRDSLRNIKILIPKSEIICEFERIANQIDNNIKNNELQSRRLSQLRDTLLPKLMSGEIDISDVAV